MVRPLELKRSRVCLVYDYGTNKYDAKVSYCRMPVFVTNCYNAGILSIYFVHCQSLVLCIFWVYRKIASFILLKQLQEV